MYHPEALDPIVAFLRGIGIGVEFGPGAHDGFLPGVNIHGGVIHVDPETLVGSGDVLHEAGHIAVVPQRFWPDLNKDIQADTETIMAAELAAGRGEDPLLARAIHRGEFMAQAWSYAAALHIGVSPACIFFPGAYKYHAYEGAHPMQAWLERGDHYGPLGLAESGMSGYSGLFAYVGHNGLTPFPHMARWVI